METRTKTCSRSIHPQCPMLTASQLFVDLCNRDTVAETDVFDSSSYLNTDDVCALSFNSRTHLPNTKKDTTASVSTSFFWCNFCSYTTESKTSLVEHVASHRFGCQNCPFISYSRSRVVQHVLLEHNQAISEYRDLRYCTLVHSKDVKTESDAWHKPCSQEMEDDGTVLHYGDHLGLGDASGNKESNIRRTKDNNKIHFYFKKAYVNGSAEGESVFGTKNVCSAEDTDIAESNESGMQLPVSKPKRESTITLCTLKDDTKMSQTQKTFPTINTLLTSVSDSANRPPSECWQSFQRNENNISFPKLQGITTRCRQSRAARTTKNSGHDIDVQKMQICSVFSTSTIMVNNGQMIKHPADELEYPETAIPHAKISSSLYDTAQRKNLGSGSIKYIYGDPYYDKTTEQPSQSKHSSELKSQTVKMDICNTAIKNKDCDEDDAAYNRVQMPTISKNVPTVLDTVIKMEPVDTESQSFSSEDRNNIDVSAASAPAAVQYPTNDHIQIKREICNFDEGGFPHSHAPTMDSVSTFPTVKLVCKQECVEANNQDVTSGSNDLLTEQDGSSSPPGDSSSILWDCGQCDFQSNDYEACRRHIRTTHFVEGNNLSCNEHRIRPAELNRQLVHQDFGENRDLLKQSASSDIYSCRACNYANPSSDAVKSHNNEQHLPSLLAMYSNNKMVFYCPEKCDYLSDVKADYLSHVKRCRGTLTRIEYTRTAIVMQASLMLTVRYIFSNHNTVLKRMFTCTSCDFETDVLAEMTVHNTIHSDNRQVAIKLDPCSKKVSWICLKCQIPIKLMQLKKHQCSKLGVLECSDLACNQCHFGKRKSMYVCSQCKYETGCLLMIMKHQTNVCKGFFKEIKLSTDNTKAELHCFRCDRSYGVDDISTQDCLDRVKPKAVDTQSKYNTRRLTRSALKRDCASSLENSDKKEKTSVGELLPFTESGSQASGTMKTAGPQSKRPKKRKSSESPKQTQSISLKTPIEKTQSSGKISKLTEHALEERNTDKPPGEQDTCVTSCTQSTLSPTEDDNVGHVEDENKPRYFSYTAAQRNPTIKVFSKHYQTLGSKVDNGAASSVLAESGSLARSSMPDISHISVNGGCDTSDSKEMHESEFKPLSMLEWLNTESRRMLQLLKS
ncbi:uncharacterized protein LOC121375313 [Gigantopelta aegis]|uniref:uncharacterized protein LOC121375313 n=1 Tax=Gigantopelta aegis TaxID=1735272 RepID=UPI001B88AE0D|nr:uncharacterized protein LOC121375313 [Gigantopelta aegis]